MRSYSPHVGVEWHWLGSNLLGELARWRQILPASAQLQNLQLDTPSKSIDCEQSWKLETNMQSLQHTIPCKGQALTSVPAANPV